MRTNKTVNNEVFLTNQIEGTEKIQCLKSNCNELRAVVNE
jgi:hypothetical protein